MKKIIVFLVVLFLIIAIVVVGKMLSNDSGSLTVNSYPTKASVYINGELKGETPLSITNLPLGKYEVKVSLTGFKDYTEEVELTANNSNKLISVILEHSVYSIDVDSDPPQANVYLDGVLKGTTPIQISDIPYGKKHVLEIKLENYNTFKQIVDENTPKIFAKLEPISTHLIVTSIPSNASVYLDDKFIGTTPLDVKNLDEGDFELKVKLKQYETYSEHISLKKGETIERNITLRKSLTYVSINSNPQGAKTYIDGTLIGSTPIEITNLSEGSHTIRLELDGYLPYETNIEIKKDKPTELNINLLKLP